MILSETFSSPFPTTHVWAYPWNKTVVSYQNIGFLYTSFADFSYFDGIFKSTWYIGIVLKYNGLYLILVASIIPIFSIWYLLATLGYSTSMLSLGGKSYMSIQCSVQLSRRRRSETLPWCFKWHGYNMFIKYHFKTYFSNQVF